MYEKLGFEITYLDLNKDGTVCLDKLKDEDFDYIFISSYVMDTFLKTDLKSLKFL